MDAEAGRDVSTATRTEADLATARSWRAPQAASLGVGPPRFTLGSFPNEARVIPWCAFENARNRKASGIRPNCWPRTGKSLSRAECILEFGECSGTAGSAI
jgi:hypothetical protein